MMADFPKFQRDLERIIEKTFSKRTLDKIGKAIVERIRSVTSKGSTIAEPDGKVSRLEILKDSTKAKKKRDGKSQRSRLRESGDMMRDLNHRTNVAKGRVTVENRTKDERQKAKWAHDGSSNRPTRKFIPQKKLDKKTDKAIERILEKELEKQLRRL